MESYNSDISSHNAYPQESGDNYATNLMTNNMTHHLHSNVVFDGVPQMDTRGVYEAPVMTAQLRRPNIVNSDISDLTRRANDMSLNESTSRTNASFSAIGGGDVSDNWMTARPSTASTANKPSLNPYAKEFVPQSAMSYSANTDPIANGMGSEWSTTRASNQTASPGAVLLEDFIALNYLKDFIDTITTKPNKFDTGITQLTHVINDYMSEDELVLDAVVNTIVDQSIVDQQFRYNGVRLCIHFMNNLIPYNEENTFKGLLLKRCQREHSRRERLIKGTEVMVNYLRGVSLFIGDLYARCEEPELAEYLPQFLLTLMSDISKEKAKENLKSVCQVLKLCGASLQLHYNKVKRNDFSCVLEQLKKCGNSNEVTPNIKDLITSVIGLEMRGWTSNTPMASTDTPIINPYLNNTYADGNGGNNFEEYYDEYTGYSDEEDYQICYDFGGDEADNDVCEAFEQFLKNSGQSK